MTRDTIFKKNNEDIFASMFYITENGYGDRGLPHVMKPLMKDFKYRVPKPNLNTKDRCQRIGFLPFRNNNGTVYKSAYRELQLPNTGPSDNDPVILVVLHEQNPMQRILATAVLVPYHGGVKLEYLCARKGKGHGATLMNVLLEIIKWEQLVKPIAEQAHGQPIVKMTLNNNSNKPNKPNKLGFYKGFGFINTGKKSKLSAVNTTLDNTNQTENTRPQQPQIRNNNKANMSDTETASNTASNNIPNTTPNRNTSNKPSNTTPNTTPNKNTSNKPSNTTPNTSNTSLNKKREAKVLEKVVYEKPVISGRQKRHKTD